MTRDPAVVVAEAEAFVAFCDGMSECGFDTFARKGRNVARDLLAAAEALEDERRLRVAMQADRDRLRGLLERGARERVAA